MAAVTVSVAVGTTTASPVSSTPTTTTTPTTTPTSTPAAGQSTVTPTTTTTEPVTSTYTPVVTPTTQVTVVTAVQTLTVSGTVVTSSSVRSSSVVTSATAASDLRNTGSSTLSTGAKAGIIAGSVVGGLALLALLAFLVFGCIKRRRNSYTPGEDEIKWPAHDADAAQLYPAAAQSTGGHGMLERGDSLRSANGASAYSSAGQSLAAVGGAGVAGAGAYGAHQAYAQQAPPSTYWGSTADHSGAYDYTYETAEAPQRPLSGSDYTGLDRNGSIAESAWRGRETGPLHVANY